MGKMATIPKQGFGTVFGRAILSAVTKTNIIYDILQCHKTSVRLLTTSSLWTTTATRSASTNTTSVSEGDSLPRKKCEPISFDDFHSAFKQKTFWEIARALFVLRICSFDKIVDNSLKLMTASETILGKRLFSSLMKRTMYGQFVAGDDVDSIKETCDKLKQAGVGPMLAIPMEEDIDEGFRDQVYDQNLKAVLDCIKLSADIDRKHPMMQIKVTALISADLCAKLSCICPCPSKAEGLVDHVTQVIAGSTKSAIEGLDEEENLSFSRAMKRFQDIGQLATRTNVIVWVDAEYTYVNPALNLISLAMMMNFNTAKPLIGYTYQNYLKCTSECLKGDLDFVDKTGICFAVKLVRGAYMDKERHLATVKCYEDPVHPTLNDTSDMYHKSMDMMLRRIAAGGDKYSVILASHNETTIREALDRVNDLSIDPKSGHVFFGQQMGMSDHVSFSLGRNKYLVYKSLPYGSVQNTLAYLSRRAQENRSAFHRMDRERALLRRALKERLMGYS